MIQNSWSTANVLVMQIRIPCLGFRVFCEVFLPLCVNYYGFHFLMAFTISLKWQYTWVHHVQKLVEALHSEQNIPTVLQSLGCLAQHSVSTFESHDGMITPYIYQNIFQVIDIIYDKYVYIQWFLGKEVLTFLGCRVLISAIRFF